LGHGAIRYFLGVFMDSRNRDVYLNFGLIVYGSLKDIERLQRMIESNCKGLRVVYQTVTAKRLWLTKRRLDNGESGGV